MWVRRGSSPPAESGTHEMKPSDKLSEIENISRTVQRKTRCIYILKKYYSLICKVYSVVKTYTESDYIKLNKRPQLLSSVTTRGAEKLWVNGKGVISAPINRRLAPDNITRCRHQDGAYSTKYALFFSYILPKQQKEKKKENYSNIMGYFKVLNKEP